MDIEGNRRGSRRRRDVIWSDISCFSTDLFSSISPLVCQGYELLCEHKQRALAVFFVMLETISLVLDVFGQSRRRILLAAFLLSVFGFVMTNFTCILEKTKVYAEKQLGVVEIGFSVVQLIATFLAVLGVKSTNNYTAAVMLLVFSIIAAVFIFRKDRIKGPWSPEEAEAEAYRSYRRWRKEALRRRMRRRRELEESLFKHYGGGEILPKEMESRRRSRSISVLSEVKRRRRSSRIFKSAF